MDTPRACSGANARASTAMAIIHLSHTSFMATSDQSTQ
jgi:hypothetical protein